MRPPRPGFQTPRPSQLSSDNNRATAVGIPEQCTKKGPRQLENAPCLLLTRARGSIGSGRFPESHVSPFLEHIT
ncbi:hypothetical protein V5799_027472 [Amblyomma americanum]|uniref:Uncharacterized protein n=1 Tax=Amblyomma americanum TaxID=6943 RepID=A0AAQ4DFM1_AMBAM